MLKKFHSILEKLKSLIARLLSFWYKEKKTYSDAKNIISTVLEIAVGTVISEETVKQIRPFVCWLTTFLVKFKTFRERLMEPQKLLALQINESKDISNKTYLISFLRIIRGGKIISQFFFCCKLQERTRGDDVFNLAN